MLRGGRALPSAEPAFLGIMGLTSNERLRNYLGQLPPRSQALLMREFERAIERGEDTAVASLVLEQLRKVVRGSAEDAPDPPRSEDAARLVFRPLDPFIVDGNVPIRQGQIRRASLMPIWQWLVRAGAPDSVRDYDAALAAMPDEADVQVLEPVIRKLQIATVEAIARLTVSADGDRRALARVGPPEVIEDLVSIGLLLGAREAFDALGGRLPVYMRAFGDAQIESVLSALNVPTLQGPQLLPFALSLVMQRLSAPWQIIRLAINMAGSDDEMRVSATPYGIAVSLALHDFYCMATRLRMDIRRGQFANVGESLKALHEGVRGLRTELDLRQDSSWGKQLASIRADISNTLQSEIDSVPGRVRRILRQRADKDVLAGARVDNSDVDEVVSLIDFVAICRTYADELAINEVTLRTYSDLQHYVEQATEALVESLRGGDARARAYRHMQAEAAIRFSEVLFGRDYASLMRRAAENALSGERKPSRTA
jgi:hypothetical protein